MNCREMEELIALYVSGDLDRRDERLVADHLVACENCARLAAELRADLEDLRELRAEPADESTLAPVRLSVLEKLESQRARTLPPLAWMLASSNIRWAVVGLVVVLVVFGALHHAEETGPLPSETKLAGRVGVPAEPIEAASKRAAKEPPVAQPKTAPIHARATTMARVVRAHRNRTQTKETALVQAGEVRPIAKHAEIIDSNVSSGVLSPPATLIKLASSDPDVVLYWLVESNGG